jgi:hypothetical protein
MRVYKTPHSYYCGVDLHARSLIVNILDDKGRTRLEQDLPASSPMLSQLTSSLKGSFCQRAPGMCCLRRCKSSAGRIERNRKGRQGCPSRGGI